MSLPFVVNTLFLLFSYLVCKIECSSTMKWNQCIFICYFLSFHCSISFLKMLPGLIFIWSNFIALISTHFKEADEYVNFYGKESKDMEYTMERTHKTHEKKSLFIRFNFFLLQFFPLSFFRSKHQKGKWNSSVIKKELNAHMCSWLMVMSWISVEIPIISSISKMILNDDNGHIFKRFAGKYFFFIVFFLLRSLNLNPLIICVLDLFILHNPPTDLPPPPYPFGINQFDCGVKVERFNLSVPKSKQKLNKQNVGAKFKEASAFERWKEATYEQILIFFIRVGRMCLLFALNICIVHHIGATFHFSHDHHRQYRSEECATDFNWTDGWENLNGIQ